MTVVTSRAGYCPMCREFSAAPPDRPCPWCDTELVTKRGGWKRPDRRLSSRISPRVARAMHAAHEQGVSLRSISEQTYERLGYASANSCLEGIRSAFDRDGLRSRSQSEATARANVARGNRLPGEDKNAYRRRRRREAKLA